MSKAYLTGHIARTLFGNMASVAMRITNNAGDALLAQYNGDEKAAMKAISEVMKDTRLLERVLMLLENGHVDDAITLITEKKK